MYRSVLYLDSTKRDLLDVGHQNMRQAWDAPPPLYRGYQEDRKSLEWVSGVEEERKGVSNVQATENHGKKIRMMQKKKIGKKTGKEYLE